MIQTTLKEITENCIAAMKNLIIDNQEEAEIYYEEATNLLSKLLKQNLSQNDRQQLNKFLGNMLNQTSKYLTKDEVAASKFPEKLAKLVLPHTSNTNFSVELDPLLSDEFKNNSGKMLQDLKNTAKLTSLSAIILLKEGNLKEGCIAYQEARLLYNGLLRMLKNNEVLTEKITEEMLSHLGDLETLLLDQIQIFENEKNYDAAKEICGLLLGGVCSIERGKVFTKMLEIDFQRYEKAVDKPDIKMLEKIISSCQNTKKLYKHGKEENPEDIIVIELDKLIKKCKQSLPQKQNEFNLLSPPIPMKNIENTLHNKETQIKKFTSMN